MYPLYINLILRYGNVISICLKYVLLKQKLTSAIQVLTENSLQFEFSLFFRLSPVHSVSYYWCLNLYCTSDFLLPSSCTRQLCKYFLIKWNDPCQIYEVTTWPLNVNFVLDPMYNNNLNELVSAMRWQHNAIWKFIYVSITDL